MKVLIVGGGGREHALAHKIGQSPLVDAVYCVPGNAGIAQEPKTRCWQMNPTDIKTLAEFANAFGIGLTVVGPEAPLAAGIVDEFEKKGLGIVGPRKEAALIESSKDFAKKFMKRWHIPTARFAVFNSTEAEHAIRYGKSNLPCVFKADGLTGGKGVVICFTAKDISAAVERIMVKKEFGSAGDAIVIEEFLKGREATFMVATDGYSAIPLIPAQDHKSLFDSNEGPKTGGMGACASASLITRELEKKIMESIISPAIYGMRKEGRLFKGILYAGLMITPEGPKVLEFNCRLGDPEFQAMVLLLESDIVPFLEWTIDGNSKPDIKWSDEASVCVVMTSKGYPGVPEIGKNISGLEQVAKMGNVVVFHSGTEKRNGKWFTSGGRVLGVTAKAGTIQKARERAYQVVDKIFWQGEHHRTDIGKC